MLSFAALRHACKTGPEAALAVLCRLREQWEKGQHDRWNLLPIAALAKLSGNTAMAERVEVQGAALAEQALADWDERLALLGDLVDACRAFALPEAAREAFALLLRHDPLRASSPAWLAPSAAPSGSGCGTDLPGPVRLAPARSLVLPPDTDVRHLCGLGDALAVLTNVEPRLLLLLDTAGETRGAVAFSRPPNSLFPFGDGQIGICDPDGCCVHVYDRACRPVRTLDLGQAVGDGSLPRPLYGCFCGERVYCVVQTGGANRILCCDTGGDKPAGAYLEGFAGTNFLKIFSHDGQVFAGTSQRLFQVFKPSGTMLGLDLAASVPLDAAPYHFAFAGRHVFCSSRDWLFGLDTDFHLAGRLRVDAGIFPETPPPGRWPVPAVTASPDGTILWLTLVMSNRLYGYRVHG